MRRATASTSPTGSSVTALDLVLVPGSVSHVELGWRVPTLARILSRLAEISRVILLDKCGTGMSDGLTETRPCCSRTSSAPRHAPSSSATAAGVSCSSTTYVRRELARYRGVEHDTAGDGFFASFDGPARAVRCASAIRDSLREIDVHVRLRLHAGECELLDGKVAGIAVSIGARVAGHAGPGEVLVSGTVKDLVAGSDLGFEDRGTASLKGVPGEWRLYAVV